MKLNFTGLDKKQTAALSEISPQLGFELSADGICVSVARGESLTVSATDGGAAITYVSDNQLWRAISMLRGVLLSAETETGKGSAVREEPGYSMLCYMADMSRNAVYNMAGAKRMIRYLALMGYDSLMLYTEDTYENPDYPYFGYMRGRFSEEELQQIDDYADMFGIEVIPCIQTLAHLNAALRWPGIKALHDIDDILLADNEDTYKFIESCLRVCTRCFRSRRINIGMDEAHLLGRGKYLTKNGFRPASDIMLSHLDRVVSLCRASGFAPMMWSDMFFRMAFGKYRVREGEISQDIIDRIPHGLILIYWDYYSLDREIFMHMVNCHLKFNNPTIFAGGAWKWSGFAPNNRFSLESTKMQLDVCAETGLDNIIVTAWGDNGGEASQFSVLSTMLYFAERGYRRVHPTDEELEARSNECFGIGYEALLTLDAPNELPGTSMKTGIINPSKYLLWNDPLEGLFDANLDPNTAPTGFAESASRLLAYAEHPQFGYIFATLAELCSLLSKKCDLSLRIRRAYLDGNKKTLEEIADKEIPEILALLDSFRDSFRRQWYIENKTFGFSVQELRIGGLRERLESTAERLGKYAKGELDRIEELDAEKLTIDGRSAQDSAAKPYINHNSWSAQVTGCVLG